MVQPLFTVRPDMAVSRSSAGVRSVVLWGSAGLLGLLSAAAAVLWFRYGTTVFFETIANGFANCF